MILKIIIDNMNINENVYEYKIIIIADIKSIFGHRIIVVPDSLK